MSTANEPGDGLWVEFTTGGDPGLEVVAAVTAVVTRPVVVASPSGQDDATDDQQPAWLRAARLEAVAPGRRIATLADLARPR